MMIFIFFAAGIIFWTFTEYAMHRFLGHVHKGKNFFKSEHLQHHSKANYFSSAYKKGIVAALVFLFFFFLFSAIFSKILVFSFLAGLFGMYGSYELAHYRYHSKEPLLFIFVILRKHHFYHHFHNPKVNLGVTTRIWDRVFGTFVRVEKVRVPQKMSMKWLTDGTTIKPIYSADFSFAASSSK